MIYTETRGGERWHRPVETVTMKCLLETATIITAIISLLNGISAVPLQLFLQPSVDVPEGGSVTLPCSFSPPAIELNALLIKWWIVSEKIVDRDEIYDSHFRNSRPKVAQFVGDEKNGNCSLRIFTVSRTDNLEFSCQVLCDSCNLENTEVEGRVKVNVMAAAPRSHGVAGGTTRAPGVETTPTHGLSSRETRLLVIGLVVGVIVGVVVGVVATIIIIKERGRISCLSQSGNWRAEVNGGDNGVPLKTNGEPVKTNGVPLLMNGQHAGDERGQEERQENGMNVV